jgi:hypothetical protein
MMRTCQTKAIQQSIYHHNCIYIYSGTHFLLLLASKDRSTRSHGTSPNSRANKQASMNGGGEGTKKTHDFMRIIVPNQSTKSQRYWRRWLSIPLFLDCSSTYSPNFLVYRWQNESFFFFFLWLFPSRWEMFFGCYDEALYLDILWRPYINRQKTSYRFTEMVVQ